jgi:excisionase family DNA binding protein
VTPRRSVPPVVTSPGVRRPDELCTVEAAAAHLQLHRKTVLRYIRESRLAATKVGKGYRIRWADLAAFAGEPGTPGPTTTALDRARVTSIIDVADIDAVLARKVASSVTNSLHTHPEQRGDVHAEVVYDAERAQLKIVVVGELAATATLLQLVEVWLEQLTS